MLRTFTLMVTAILLLGQLSMATSAAQGKGFALASVLEQGVEKAHGCCDDAKAALDAKDYASDCVHAILGELALMLSPSPVEANTPFLGAMRPIQEWPNGPPPILNRI
ncbi:hypothetical protein [Maritalea mediterranea]|uniref:Uncharacterized protein n=1 Tax=Maritalea mediterranea TaxID=2909667 RepID=A0ABS9E775_9HYPH|nr:hypothetical protein [Maritalea mediterranea]MCF4098638.1 hypothetical protein [Maritalea mediterranea]